MKQLITPLLLLLSFETYSQEKDTYQVDSIMRINNVKTKIRYPENTVSKAKQIYNFDKQGRLVEYILTDNSEYNKVQFKVTYVYNDFNKVIQEIDSSYNGEKPSVEITTYTYEPNGNYKAVVFNVKKKKKVLSEIIFQADSNIVTHRFFNDKNEVVRENISYFESQNYTCKFAGSEKDNGSPKSYVINGKEYKIISEDKWEYIFKNKYDSTGKLIERERIVNGVVQDKCIYSYDSDGLLSVKTKITFYNGKESKGNELFKYIKWE
jgi:hypothetical protein